MEQEQEIEFLRKKLKDLKEQIETLELKGQEQNEVIKRLQDKLKYTPTAYRVPYEGFAV